MAITTNNPVSIPATAATTCDRVWLETVVIDGSALDAQPVTATIICRPYSQDEQGAKTFAAVSDQRTYRIADVYGLAASNADVATALTAMLTAVQGVITAAEAQQQGA